MAGATTWTTADPMASGASHPIQYWVDLPAGSFEVREIEGVERLSQPFRFEARVVTDAWQGFDPDVAVGERAAVRIERDGIEIRRIEGVLSEGSVSATALGHPELHFIVEPRFALLRFRSDARVFVNRTAPEIVSEVLSEAGVPFELRLRDAYPERSYCVQLCETDFDFVSRLLEDEGIFYTFAADGTMVLGDSPAAYEEMAEEHALPFHPAEGLGRDREVVFALGRRAALAPSAVTLRDFNPEKPNLDMDVTVKGPTAEGVEHYDYPGKYALPSEGERKARLIAGSMETAAAAIVGASDSSFLAPGRTFSLVNSPEEIPDGSYVITALAHAWHHGDAVESAFEALEADRAYRPPRLTSAPVLENPLTGFVTGPEGADIHTDALGRVKVRFPWDRRSPADDTVSHWIPVLQDNTGHSMGIPRVGWEVLVGFLEGDADRPVVLGRVYNGADPFPEVLPANKTVSALKSLTSPGRDGSNEIRIEDKAGREQVYIQAERDQNVVVANDKRERVLNTEANRIGANETIQIGNNQKVDVGQNHQLTVQGDQHLTVAGWRTRKVGDIETATVGANRSTTIAGKHKRRIKGFDNVATASLKEQVGSVDLETSLKPNSTNAGKGMILTVGGAVVEVAGKNKEEKTLLFRQETVGGLLYTRAHEEIKIRADTSRSTTVLGVLQAHGGVVKLEGKEKLSIAAASGKVAGATSLAFSVGGSTVTLMEGEIIINTGGEIVIEATGESNLGAAEMKISE